MLRQGDGMSVQDTDCWPTFESVTFPIPPEIPFEWVVPLVTQGVPKDIWGYFKPAQSLTLVTKTSYGPFIRIGVDGDGDGILFEPMTGHIVWDLTTINEPPLFINTSLAQFNACAAATYQRFPFDSWSKENPLDPFYDFDQLNHEWQKAVEELSQQIKAIDPDADVIDGFWGNLLFTISIGDCSTELILSNS